MNADPLATYRSLEADPHVQEFAERLWDFFSARTESPTASPPDAIKKKAVEILMLAKMSGVEL